MKWKEHVFVGCLAVLAVLYQEREIYSLRRTVADLRTDLDKLAARMDACDLQPVKPDISEILSSRNGLNVNSGLMELGNITANWQSLKDITGTFTAESKLFANDMEMLKESTSDLTLLRDVVHDLDITTKKHSSEIHALDKRSKRTEKIFKEAIEDLNGNLETLKGFYPRFSVFFDVILDVLKRIRCIFMPSQMGC